MPRIRNIKPRFWDSPDTAKADLAVRLLFMAMWNWADDSGRGTANLKELEAFAFPHDTVAELPRRRRGNSAAVWPSFGHILAEVQECYGVVFYRVGSRNYFQIPSFKDHQSKNFKPDSTFPGPDEGVVWDLTSEFILDDRVEVSTNVTAVAEIPQQVAEFPRLAAEDHPLDRDEDGDWDGDNTTPVTYEPSPRARETRRTGAEIARAKFSLIPTSGSQLASGIVRAYGESLGAPVEAKTAKEMSKVIDSCLQAGQSPEAIAAGIEMWAKSDSFSPNQIPKYILKAAAARKSAGIGKPTQQAITTENLAAEIIAEMGQP
ncbi:hypothetical protein SEA_NITZEL_69 [Mycobacterium phage Nitzel]|uniref:Helix-turn-helix DNA binding domain protein n=1 Tax=Mycobacterium phage Nitzel TaxID=2652404 RepID=A0A5J6T9E4_9CAUD|nr:replication initiation protein [Mycobacterium phage Nitzel]QFG04895.1 hypothetical protein SEA_NITZEL_69 [Mycobacterium phage Nitzel]